MRIILKTVIKNIFGKPLRSLLVIFSIFFCALSSMFCFDLAKTEKNMIRTIRRIGTIAMGIGIPKTYDMLFHNLSAAFLRFIK